MELIDAVAQGRQALAIKKICQAQIDNQPWERPFLDHPLGDALLDTATQWIGDYMAENQGYLYIVVNPMNPGFYKVGKTKKDMASRLKGLNNEAVLVDFVVVAYLPALNYHQAETRLHKVLAEQYVQQKEFFVADYKSLLNTMATQLQQHNESYLPLCGLAQQTQFTEEWATLSGRYT